MLAGNFFKVALVFLIGILLRLIFTAGCQFEADVWNYRFRLAVSFLKNRNFTVTVM